MTTRTLLVAALVGCLGCGGANGAGGDEPAAGGESIAGGGDSAAPSPSELLCSGRLPADCGIEPSECRSRVETILPVCVNAIADTVEGELTEEQRQTAAGLGLLCSVQVIREQRALEGHACAGEDVDDRYRRMCVLCSVAAGTVRVAEEPGSEASESPSPGSIDRETTDAEATEEP